MEHGEYYADDQKVILQGGDPLFVDSVKGQTRGKQLTWWANNDRLLINGADKATPPKASSARNKPCEPSRHPRSRLIAAARWSISFGLGGGEVVGLLGPNGAGKPRHFI